jgi:hypothetical protein
MHATSLERDLRMKLYIQPVMRSILLAGGLAIIVIAASVSAQGRPGRAYTEPPPRGEFTTLPSSETRRDSHGAFVKPADDKGRQVVIPPPPPGTFDNAFREPTPSR